MRWVSLISSGHSIKMQKNTPSSDVHVEHSPGQTTPWVSNQALVNLRKWNLYQASSRPEYYEIRHQLQEEKKTVRNTNTWRLNNTFLNNEQVTGEIRREIKRFLETNDNEKMTTQNLWNAAKNSSKREFYSNTTLPQEKRKTLNRQPNFTPKTNWEKNNKK